MKGRPILDAFLAFTVLQIIILFPPGVRDLIRWENRALGGSYLIGALMIAISFIVILLRRYELRLLGLTTDNWRNSVNTGLIGWSYFLIPQALISFFLVWEINYRENLRVAVFLGAIILLMSCLLARRKQVISTTDRRLFIIGLLILTPLMLNTIFLGLSSKLLKEFIWNIFIGGFAEEVFYRGLIQSSIDLEYGKTLRIGKISFGPGLLFSSLFYGLGRGLRWVKPWMGVYTVSWSWTLFAFTVGVFYGLIREASGDIIGSSTANGMIDAIGETFNYLGP